MIKDFDIKPILTLGKNPQANAVLERVNQVILRMLVTKDLDNKVFDNIYPWDETLVYISWEIRAPYHCNIMSKSGQVVFGREMLFNITSAVDWRFVTAPSISN